MGAQASCWCARCSFQLVALVNPHAHRVELGSCDTHAHAHAVAIAVAAHRMCSCSFNWALIRLRLCQVGGFLAVFLCAFVPTIALPAYKTATADPNKTMRGQEAGFQKGGMWGQIDKS